jgi:hypothetical protein
MSQTKRKPTLSKAILNLVILIPTFFSILGKVVTLIEFEGKLASKSLIQLVTLSVILGAVLSGTWVGILAMLFIYLQSLSWTPLASLSMVLFVNVVILIIIAFYLCHARKNLFFPEIRKQLRYLQKLF